MAAATRFLLPVTLFLLILGGVIAVGVVHDTSAGSADNTSPTPTETATVTPTAAPPTPACPADTAAPGATCPPCPTFHVDAEGDVGIQSTCSPILTPTPTPTETPIVSVTPTPTPYPSITPCPTVSPTNCDTIMPPTGDANCDYVVDLEDVSVLLIDAAGIEPASCGIYANVKCDDDLDPMDALLVLAYIAETGPYAPAWCRPIGVRF